MASASAWRTARTAAAAVLTLVIATGCAGSPVPEPRLPTGTGQAVDSPTPSDPASPTVELPEGDPGTPLPTDDDGQPDLGAPVSALGPGTDLVVGLVHDGLERSARVVVPDDLAADAPLVVLLHGAGSDADEVVAGTGLADAARTEGFVLLAPTGVHQTWNAGPTCCRPAIELDIDDVGFVRALVGAVDDALPGTPAGVLVTGFSNGGFLSYRLACEAADLVHVVVPVAGTMDVDCAPTRPVSILHVHGALDPLVRLEDTREPHSPQAASRGAGDVVRAWAALDGCDGPAPRTEGDGPRDLRFAHCREGVTVRLVVGEDVPHVWPRAAPDATALVVEAVTGMVAAQG